MTHFGPTYQAYVSVTVLECHQLDGLNGKFIAPPEFNI